MIATLDLPKKPKGKARSDLETWWNQLSDKEMLEVIRSFTTSFRSGVDAWELEDAGEIAKWDGRRATSSFSGCVPCRSRRSLRGLKLSQMQRGIWCCDTVLAELHATFDRTNVTATH